MAEQKEMHTFALAFKKYGSVAQLNRASDYGSEGCRFESCRSHKKRLSVFQITFFVFTMYHSLYYCIPRLSGNLVGISINLCKSIQKVLFINDTFCGSSIFMHFKTIGKHSIDRLNLSAFRNSVTFS